MKVNLWAITSIIFLIWAIIATTGLVNYYQISQKQQTTIENLQSIISDVAIKVNIAISYGNGTTIWYNNTYIPNGWSLFNASVKLCKIEYKVYPFGIYITSINGVSENPKEGKYWIWYRYTNNTWEYGPIGSDQYILKNNEIIKWELTKF
ncbi:MAG: DUF4430 domain-containing protein [Candidatus Methanomethylicia archaeon]|nr:DUF4430 domain-containing protein [Candidatus Methanomethylicia archaeon]